MNNSIKIKKIRDISIVGVTGSFLYLVSNLIPFLFFLVFLLPLPYIFLIKKHGHSSGTLAVTITALLNGIFLGVFGLFYTVVGFGLIAIVVGGAFREQLKPSKILILSILASIVSELIFYYILARSGAIGLLREGIRQNLNIINNFLIDNTGKEALEHYINIIVQVIPGMFAGVGIVTGIFNYYLAAFSLRKAGYYNERIRPFKEWLFPRWVALVYIILVFLPNDVVTLNLELIFTTILTLQGIAVLVYFGEKWGLYPWVRNLLIFVVIFLFFFILYLPGLIDSVFNLRGLKKDLED